MNYNSSGPGSPYQGYPQQPAPNPYASMSGAWNPQGPTGAQSPYNPYVNPAYNPAQYAQTQSMLNQWMQSAMQPRTAGERFGDLSNSIFNSIIAPGLAESSAPGTAEGIAKGMETALDLEQQRREQYDQRQSNYVKGIETFSNVLENTAPVKREQYQNWLDTQKAQRDFEKMQQDIALNQLQQQAAKQGMETAKMKRDWEVEDRPLERQKAELGLESARNAESRAAGQYKLDQNDEIRKQRAEADARARAETPEEAKQRRALEYQERKARIKEAESKVAAEPLLKKQKEQEAADTARANFAKMVGGHAPQVATDPNQMAELERRRKVMIDKHGYSEKQADVFIDNWLAQQYPKGKTGKKPRQKNAQAHG